MAPKKPTKAKPAKIPVIKTPSKLGRPKSSPNKSSPSKASSDKTAATIIMQNHLLFLWSCFQTTGAAIDYAVVCDEYGIKNNAARMRFIRLKALIEKLQAEGNDKAPGDDKKSEADAEQLQDELIESIEKDDDEEDY